MARGTDKANALYNNAPGYQPWTWAPSDWWDRPENTQPMAWSSNRHALRVLAVEGDKFVICNERGQFLRGPKRVRKFRSMSAAQIAADVEVGV